MDELKKRICEAFCAQVEVASFDRGLAIGTPYLDRAGDKIGAYAIGREGGPYRLVDNALTLSVLEADGFNLESGSRREALSDLLRHYGAGLDEEMGEVFIDGVTAEALPKAALDFSALLLRMNDLVWLASDRVRNTFRDDVKDVLRKEFSGRAIVVEDEPVSPALHEITPDMVFKAEGRDPVALFIAIDESKLWQAMHLRLIADYEQHAQLSVIAMLQRESSVSSKVRIKADNRLDATLRYEDEPNIALQRIASEVFGRPANGH